MRGVMSFVCLAYLVCLLQVKKSLVSPMIPPIAASPIDLNQFKWETEHTDSAAAVGAVCTAPSFKITSKHDELKEP